MINIAVCDDEEFERDRMKDLICRYAIEHDMEINTDYYKTGDDLLSCYEKGKYTMIFLDIEMGKNDGIMIADKIRRFPDHEVIIMYVTNYPEYMQQSFDVRAAQFFSKPLKYEVFKDKMNKTFEYMSYEEDKKIILNRNNEKIILSLSDIYTIESVKTLRSNSDILITTVNEQIKIKGKLRDFNNEYGDILAFASRSVLVNVKNIHKWMSDKIVMKNGRDVFISRNRIQEVKELFTKSVLRGIGR